MNQGRSRPIINVDHFDAAIFDLDGVVTQTARVHAAAWKRLFDEYLRQRAFQTGDTFVPFDPDGDYRHYVDGKPRYDGVKSFLESRGITLPHGDPTDGPDRETICGIGNRKDSLFRQALQEHGADAYPAAIMFIREVRSRGLKTAIVSSSKNCASVLDAAGISALFEAKVDGLDLAQLHLKGKPAPDMFVKAAALLGVPPARAAVFEDAIAGVQAGRKGNFGLVVGVDRGGQAAALQKHGADLVVSNLGEITLGHGTNGQSRNAEVLPSALDFTEEIIRCTEGKRLAVFLDYDGTLTPIVQRPELATMSEEMRATIKALADECLVVLISGRDRPDVEEKVKVNSLVYAGSHGFDIAGPEGLRLQYEQGVQFIPVLDQAEKALRERLSTVQGTIIEHKKYSVAVHYRLVADNDLTAVQEAVNAVLSCHPGLRKTEGKKVYELQPRIDWNKGKAVLWLLQKLQFDKTACLPIYIGDDITDEDAFNALEDFGVGIVVGRTPRPTAARYALASPDEVREFLRRLISIVPRRSR
ncbi:MAG: trehalose-phosphatase [Nitrospirales bacterium]